MRQGREAPTEEGSLDARHRSRRMANSERRSAIDAGAVPSRGRSRRVRRHFWTDGCESIQELSGREDLDPFHGTECEQVTVARHDDCRPA